MPLLSNITLGTMQLDKYRPPGNHQNDFSIGLPKTFKRESVIRNSRGHLCAALVSSSSLLFNSASYAWYCTCWWKAWIQLLGQSHPMNLSTRCSSANLKATLSLEVCCDRLCRNSVTFATHAPQNGSADALILYAYLLSSWHFQSLPLCNDITNSCLLLLMKFLDWTCASPVILSRRYAGINWAPASDPFFHKCL